MKHPVCTDRTAFYVIFNERKKIFNKTPRCLYVHRPIRRNIYLNVSPCFKNREVSATFIKENTITHVAIS